MTCFRKRTTLFDQRRKKRNQTVILIEAETAQLLQIPLKVKPEVRAGPGAVDRPLSEASLSEAPRA